MQIHEHHTQGFVAGYMARVDEEKKIIRRAKAEHRNVVKALAEDGVFNFRSMLIRAENKVRRAPRMQRFALWLSVAGVRHG